MITLETKARLSCDYADPNGKNRCENYVQVRLALTPAGGFLPDIPAHAYGAWQLMLNQGNPSVPWTARCPIHKQEPNRILAPDGIVS